MNKTLKAIALSAVFAGLISGCGWQLRGQTSLPEGTENIFVSAADSHGKLMGEFTQLLKANQVTAVQGAQDAQYSIYIEREDNDKRTVSVGSNTLAAEYELTMKVDYRIESAAGGLLVPSTTAQVARSYEYDRNDVIAKDEEEKLIKAEMRRNLVQQIFRRLRFASQNAASSADSDINDNTSGTPSSSAH